MGPALVTVFADEPGEVQITRLELLTSFFSRFATGAGVGRFAFVRVQFATARAPKTAVRLLRTFEQENLVPVVEAVEQGGDFVGQLHPASETGAGKSRKKPEGCGHLRRSRWSGNVAATILGCRRGRHPAARNPRQTACDLREFPSAPAGVGFSTGLGSPALRQAGMPDRYRATWLRALTWFHWAASLGSECSKPSKSC